MCAVNHLAGDVQTGSSVITARTIFKLDQLILSHRHITFQLHTQFQRASERPLKWPLQSFDLSEKIECSVKPGDLKLLKMWKCG